MQTRSNKVPLRKAAWLLYIAVFLSGWLYGAKTWAKTFYVSDTTLEAILRRGPGIDHRIIASLPIGTRITMIRIKNGWAELSLSDGRTGWTLERYLSARPPWRFTAEKLAKEKEQLESQIGQIESRSRELREKNQRFEEQLAAQRKELEVTFLEYDTLKKGAAKYLGLQEAHVKISSELPKLKAELEKAQQAYDKLQSSAKMRWFLYGAGVMTLGWIVGLIMGGWRRRRSSKVYR
jgi:SH3 domain protein